MKTSVDIYRAFLQLKNISSEIFCYIDFEKSILTAYSKVQTCFFKFEKAGLYFLLWLSLLVSQRKRPDYGICRRI